MRDYSTCVNGKQCVNPINGKLTENDYYETSHRGRSYRHRKCKSCYNAQTKKRRYERDYATCRNGTGCLNPHQGALEESDYSFAGPLKKDGSERSRSAICRICVAASRHREKIGYNPVARGVLETPLDELMQRVLRNPRLTL